MNCILCGKEKPAFALQKAIVNGKEESVCKGHGMTSPAARDEIVGEFPVTQENRHKARRARFYLNKVGATVSMSYVTNVFSDGSWSFRGSSKTYKTLMGATKLFRKFIDEI